MGASCAAQATLTVVGARYDVGARANGRRLKAIDLFCGVGGLTLGLTQAGFDVALAVDIDPINVASHHGNFPETLALKQDLSVANGHALLAAAGLNPGELTLVAAGPPCQGFSIGGRRQVGDPRNDLLLQAGRLIRETGPAYFLVENVDGLGGHGWPTLRTFVNDMRRSGYRIVDPIEILDASNYGVPQRRKRMLVIGHRADVTSPVYPTPSASKSTVWDAISDLPSADSHPELRSQDRYYGTLGEPSEYAARLRLARDGSGDEHAVRGYLSGCLATTHSPAVRDRFEATKPGQWEAISRFLRLSRTGLAPTLRAGTGPDKGSYTAPRPIHPVEPRCITVREAARLHSYPDWYEFHPTRWHGFRQIGNSVPPLLASAVCRSILVAAQATYGG